MNRGAGGFIELSTLPSDIHWQGSFRTYGVTSMTFGGNILGLSATYEVSTWQIGIEEQLLARLSRHRDWKSPYDTQAGGFFNQIINLGWALDVVRNL